MDKLGYLNATDKTRRRIRQAFASLLAEQGALKNITVTDLAERADITRGTFYNYYNNIHEVGAELQAELEKQLFSEYNKFESTADVEQYIDALFRFLNEQDVTYRQLLSSDAPSEFLSQLESEISKRAISAMHERNLFDKNIELELLFLTSGAFAMIRKYYRGEVAVSLKDIQEYLEERIRAIFDENME